MKRQVSSCQFNCPFLLWQGNVNYSLLVKWKLRITKSYFGFCLLVCFVRYLDNCASPLLKEKLLYPNQKKSLMTTEGKHVFCKNYNRTWRIYKEINYGQTEQLSKPKKNKVACILKSCNSLWDGFEQYGMDDAEDRLLYDFIRYGTRRQMDCTTKSTIMKPSLSYVCCM